MRIEFVFSRLPDVQNVEIARMTTDLIIPDECLHLIQVEERVREIGRCIGILTRASLHITCQEMDIHSEQMNEKQLAENDNTFLIQPFAINIYFKTYRNSRTLHVVAPTDAQALGVPRELIAKKIPPKKKRGRRKKRKPSMNVADNLSPPADYWCQTDEQYEYINAVKSISEQAEILLNAAPNPHRPTSTWEAQGFHPYWYDSVVSTLQKAESQRLENLKNKPEIKPKKQQPHGKGNRPGAIPGKFKGVQFRSQLEIRFATQMESRGIVWIYEEERLGDGNYLVDFHLPDLKMWVEAKGRFTPRDHYLLRDVAEELEKRDEVLYVFTSGSPMKVTPTEFEKISRKQFWALLEERKNEFS